MYSKIYKNKKKNNKIPAIWANEDWRKKGRKRVSGIDSYRK